MSVALWIVAAVLAVMFARAGVMKATQPRDKLAEKLPWVDDVSTTTLGLIGVTMMLASTRAQCVHETPRKSETELRRQALLATALSI